MVCLFTWFLFGGLLCTRSIHKNTGRVPPNAVFTCLLDCIKDTRDQTFVSFFPGLPLDVHGLEVLVRLIVINLAICPFLSLSVCRILLAGGFCFVHNYDVIRSTRC